MEAVGGIFRQFKHFLLGILTDKEAVIDSDWFALCEIVWNCSAD